MHWPGRSISCRSFRRCRCDGRARKCAASMRTPSRAAICRARLHARGARRGDAALSAGAIRQPRSGRAPTQSAASTIAPRTSVLISTWILHRHRLLWERPDEFDPGRFLPGQQERHSSLRLSSVRRRSAHLHRHGLCDAGGDDAAAGHRPPISFRAGTGPCGPCHSRASRCGRRTD